MFEPKEVNVPFLLDGSPIEHIVYIHDENKNYISFVEAQKDIEYFMNSYEILTYTQLYSYAFNTYLKARLSKKERNLSVRKSDNVDESTPFGKQFLNRSFGPEDVHADVERCMNYFLASGKINLYMDNKICCIHGEDKTRELSISGRVSPAYQLIVLFHIFFRDKLNSEFIVPLSTEDEVYLKFLHNDKIYYVTPIKTLEECGNRMTTMIKTAKKTLLTLENRKREDFSDLENCTYIILINAGRETCLNLLRNKEFVELTRGKVVLMLQGSSVKENMLNPKFKLLKKNLVSRQLPKV